MFSTGQFFGLNFSVWNSGHESKIASIGILYCTIFVIFSIGGLQLASSRFQPTGPRLYSVWSGVHMGKPTIRPLLLILLKYQSSHATYYSTTKLIEMPPKKRLSSINTAPTRGETTKAQLSTTTRKKTSSTWLTWLSGLHATKNYFTRNVQKCTEVQCPEIAIHLVLWIF